MREMMNQEWGGSAVKRFGPHPDGHFFFFFCRTVTTVKVMVKIWNNECLSDFYA